MSWRWCSVVLRHDSNAVVAMSGSSSRSVGEMPLRVRMGSSVVGETVVMTSTDMTAATNVGFCLSCWVYFVQLN